MMSKATSALRFRSFSCSRALPITRPITKLKRIEKSRIVTNSPAPQV